MTHDPAQAAEHFRLQLAEVAHEWSLAFCGEPDDRVRTHLDLACVEIERDLAAELGPAKAATIIAELKCATFRRKIKLDALLISKVLH